MDQKKTGSFLKTLRTEKGITQEQVAEFYDVDIREIIDGERKSENMNVALVLISTIICLSQAFKSILTEGGANIFYTVFSIIVVLRLAVFCVPLYQH